MDVHNSNSSTANCERCLDKRASGSKAIGLVFKNLLTDFVGTIFAVKEIPPPHLCLSGHKSSQKSQKWPKPRDLWLSLSILYVIVQHHGMQHRPLPTCDVAADQWQQLHCWKYQKIAGQRGPRSAKICCMGCNKAVNLWETKSNKKLTTSTSSSSFCVSVWSAFFSFFSIFHEFLEWWNTEFSEVLIMKYILSYNEVGWVCSNVSICDDASEILCFNKRNKIYLKHRKAPNVNCSESSPRCFPKLKWTYPY